jgi:serine/threonine protein kinase
MRSLLSSSSSVNLHEDVAPPPSPGPVTPTSGSNGGALDLRREWSARETDVIEHFVNDNGEEFLNEYRLIRTLGEGSFGKVKLCERASGEAPHRQFAVKMLSRAQLSKMKEYKQSAETGGMVVVTQLQKAMKEFEIMKHLFHRNIVVLFELLDDPEYDRICLVLEVMAKGELMKYDEANCVFISPLTGGAVPEDIAARHLRDIASGLEYLHDRRICHRDLKPENILLNENGRCHISDFGCASEFEEEGEHKLVDTTGTYYFLGAYTVCTVCIVCTVCTVCTIHALYMHCMHCMHYTRTVCTVCTVCTVRIICTSCMVCMLCHSHPAYNRTHVL